MECMDKCKEYEIRLVKTDLLKLSKRVAVMAMTEHNSEYLNSVYREISEKLGSEVALEIYQMFKGQQINFPVRFFNPTRIQQIIVKRPTLKSFVDSELTIHRREIVEITDYKVIVKDDAKTIKARAEHEDFVPNFVNPFRKSEQDFAPIQTKTPADKDTE